MASPMPFFKNSWRLICHFFNLPMTLDIENENGEKAKERSFNVLLNFLQICLIARKR